MVQERGENCTKKDDKAGDDDVEGSNSEGDILKRDGTAGDSNAGYDNADAELFEEGGRTRHQGGG